MPLMYIQSPMDFSEQDTVSRENFTEPPEILFEDHSKSSGTAQGEKQGFAGGKVELPWKMEVLLEEQRWAHATDTFCV